MTYKHYFSTRQWTSINSLLFLAYVGISLPLPLVGPLFLDEAILFPSGSSAAIRSLAMGFALAAYPFGQLIGVLVFSGLSDRIGQRQVLIHLVWASVIAYALTGIALELGSYAGFVCARLVTGLTEATSSITKSTVGAAVSNSSHKVKLFGFLDASVSIGYVCGPVLAGMALKIFGTYSSPFFLVSLVSLGAAILTLFSFPQDQKSARTKTPNLANPPIRSPRLLKRTLRGIAKLMTDYRDVIVAYRLLRPIFFTSLIFMASTLFVDFLSAYMTIFFNADQSHILYVFMALAMHWGLSSMLPGTLINYMNIKTASILTLLTAAAGMLGLTLSQNLTGFYSSLLIAITGIAAAEVLINVQISQQGDKTSQGRLIGLCTAARLLGDGTILAVGGGLFAMGAEIPFAIAGIIWLGGAIWLAAGSIFIPQLVSHH